MTNFHKLTAILAVVCLSLSGPGFTASGQTGDVNARTKLLAVDRKASAILPGVLPAVGSAGMLRAPSFSEAISTTRISEVPRTPYAAAHRLRADGGIELRGTVLESKAWGAEKEYGLYNIPTVEGEAFSAIGKTSVCLTEGYDDGNGTYYSAYITSDNYGYADKCHLTAFNTSDWTMLYDEVMPDFSMYAFASTEDPFSGEVYACCANAAYNSYDWVKIDYESKSVTVLTKDLPIYYAAIGCDNNGQFYGVTEFGRFVKIDKATGEYTTYPSDPAIPNSVGVSTQHGGCVDNANGRFLLTTYDYTNKVSALHSFDLQTGAYSKLLDFPNGEQVLGLYIPEPPRAPLSPAAPVVTASCANGSMTADLAISIPDVFADGSEATGESFNYDISVEGTTVADGSATAGENITVPVKLEKSGVVHFAVTLSNQHGESPKVYASCYVGKGTPAAPANVTLAWSNGSATLSWDAVTTSSDGGYLAADGVTYTVSDAEGTAIIQGLTSTSAVIPVAEPASGVLNIKYGVSAVYEAKSSGVVMSAPVLIGSYKVPVSFEFNSETFARHIVVDANNDGVKWSFGYGKAMLSYNFELAADDWLISPPVALEANKTYPFKATVHAAQSRYPERIEVKAGRGATVDAMTIDVVPPTTVTALGNDPLVITGSIVTDEAGKYNIGFHGISEAGMYDLYIVSYEIEACLSGKRPKAVADLTVTPGSNFALNATVAFTVPVENLDDETIDGDLELVVTRDGETEVLQRTAAPGEKISFVDIVPEAGDYTYSVTAAAGADVSKETTASAYIGPQAAAGVDKVTAYQSADDKVTLSWTPVTADVNGNLISAADVSYDVFGVTINSQNKLELGDKITTAPLTGTTYEATVTPSAEQDFVYFAVKSYHRGVGLTSLAVGSTVFGDAYPTPHHISDKADTEEYFFEGWTSDSYTKIFLGSKANGYSAHDFDDSYIIINTPYADLNQSAYFATGRISLASLTRPSLIFWIYGFVTPSSNTNETKVTVLCDGVETDVCTKVHSDLTVNRWNRIAVDLSAYAGKDVRVKFITYGKNTAYTLYDDIYIGENFDNDLTVKLEAPDKVQTGAKFSVNVSVMNFGSKPAAGFDVKLLRDGKEIAVRKLTEPLASEESVVAVFDVVQGIYDAVESRYTAEVVYTADEVAGNNVSAPLEITRIVSGGPTVTGLKGNNTQAGNVITWQPVQTGVAVPTIVNEGFEDAVAWADEADGWLFYDGDNSPVGGFYSFDIPGVVKNVSKKSFFVWDYSELNTDVKCNPHSGNKYISALYRTDYGASDDWAISPLLDGSAQTITFYAKSYSGSYQEEIEVLYTTGRQDEYSSYVKLPGVGGSVPDEWTKYSVDLPDGTTHFAVHSVAAGAYMLLLDDFTFSAEKGFFEDLVGYNVYCDGALLNDTPVKDTSFTHADAGENHTYHVTAVYSNGESELSESLVIRSSGVDEIGADALSVRLNGRVLSVTGAGDARIVLAGVDGKTYHVGTGDFSIALSPAVYILTVGDDVRKLIVR